MTEEMREIASPRQIDILQSLYPQTGAVVVGSDSFTIHAFDHNGNELIMTVPSHGTIRYQERWATHPKEHHDDDLPVAALTEQEHATLLAALLQYRASNEEDEHERRSRGRLEQKLRQGGHLDRVDRHVLLMCVGLSGADEEEFNAFKRLLER